MARTIKDRLRRSAAARFFGRERELGRLASWLEADDGPSVVFVHGIGGIGKTSLLDALAERLQAAGASLVRLDCGEVEPTARGVLHAIGELLSCKLGSVEAAATALASCDARVVLMLDDYHRFRLLDAWFRHTFLPALPDEVRVLLASRAAPADGWRLAPGWSGLLEVLQLDALDAEAVDALLESQRVPADAAARIRRFARGHPLALRLAAGAALDHPLAGSDATQSDGIVSTLAARFAEDVGDPALRRALESAAVLRRATRSLLAAMLGTEDLDRVIERLLELPFVTLGKDGLVIHETVRTALAEALRAIDPERYRQLRRAAWGRLREEIESVGRVQMWRYTADVLYLVEQPSIREAFFPADIPHQLVEPARTSDADAILEITRKHDGADAARAVLAWWQGLPDSFSVVRGPHGEVRAYSILGFADEISDPIVAADGLARAWLEHLRSDALTQPRAALFARRILAHESGQGPSIERAACFVDVKRTYLEHPKTSRIYAPLRSEAELHKVFRPLGFRVLDELKAQPEDLPCDTIMLDFGAGGIFAWIARLIDAEYAAPTARSSLDVGTRSLVIDGRHVPLTRLEFGVMQLFVENLDRVVTRDELLRDVWQQPFGGSNVVDAVIRTLRKKLGVEAGAVETVKGHGYRFRGFGRTDDTAP